MTAPAPRRARPWIRQLGADRGSVSLLFVIVAAGLLAMAGLVVAPRDMARARD